jgi:hypothetical protein
MSYEEKDPKTVEAIDKIKAILREHDLWAAFIVVSPERVHWVYHFEPSWSCLHFDPETGKAHIRAKRADFATAEQHKRVIELTTGAIACTRDFGSKQNSDARSLYKLLESQLDIVHVYSDPQFQIPPKKEPG